MMGKLWRLCIIHANKEGKAILYYESFYATTVHDCFTSVQTLIREQRILTEDIINILVTPVDD